MCEISHRIVLNNVKSGATVTTALILIQGHVENPRESGNFTINCGSIQKFLSLPDFKCLLPLSAGPNLCSLTYCNTTTNLRINYAPPSIEHQVIPLYIVCKGHDGQFQSPASSPSSSVQVACRRIDVMLQLVQLIYAEKLNEAQLGRRSFKIDTNCRPYFSELPLERALDMNEQQLWDHLAEEIIRTEGANRVATRKYVAVMGCTRFEGIADENFSYENIKRRTRARAAIGGGGLVVFNTGCLYTWPDTVEDVQKAFQNETPVDLKNFADDSNYRRTFGGCFATNLGSLCHELGHTFDLGHTEEGIMGRSFDATEKMFLTEKEMINKRILPKRSAPGNATTRLTQVRETGSVLRDFRKEKKCNGIYFTTNCLAILDNHKWLQEKNAEGDGETRINLVAVELNVKLERNVLLSFSATNQTIQSVHPLRLIELRELGSEMVRHFWEFPRNEEEKTEFKLPSKSVLSRPWILFAIDRKGNMIKCKI